MDEKMFKKIASISVYDRWFEGLTGMHEVAQGGAEAAPPMEEQAARLQKRIDDFDAKLKRKIGGGA